MPYMFTLVSVGLVLALNTAVVERGFSLHLIIKNKLRNRLKVAQVDAMIRLKLLCPPYEHFQYQAAIDMFEDLKGLDRGLLAQLNKEVSGVQASFVADNEEEDVQDFNDADSQGTVSDCVFSEDEEVVDVESGDEQSANNHFAVDHDEAVDLDEALGLS